MLNLWKRTLELFRRHMVLWVPCSLVAILMLALGRLERAGIYWLIGFFQTQRSVLGGTAPTGDIGLAMHRAMMVGAPIGLAKEFVEVCLFVVALITTKELVRTTLEERRPDMMAAAGSILPRYREVLLFSIKYMVLSGVLVFALIGLPASPAAPERIRHIVLSKPFAYGLGLVAQGCLAWLLVPAAIRLLRPPESPKASKEDWTIGIIFAVATSAGSLVLEYLVGKAEATLIPDNWWERWAIAVVNAVIINAPQVMLFIALALLAIKGTAEESAPEVQPELG